jgi:penicillin-binding protein 1C
MMGHRPRTVWVKAVESFRALQLNRLRSKDEILELYLNSAPYGGNIRGVEMASLTYFNKHAKDLSLGEAALIAGLPKSPSRYQPNKYLPAAMKRRRTVLHSMLRERMINEQQLRQVMAGPLLICRSPRLQRASHAGWLALKRRPEGGRTHIDLDIQNELERLIDEYHRRLPGGTEIAVVIIDIAQSGIVAMVGSGDPGDPVDGQVNGVLAKRSPGSVLKPFIYAAAFEMGRLNAESVLPDVPIDRGGWSPSNFDRTFRGQVTVSEALRCSLNVPAILVAERIGLAQCCGVLEGAGVQLPANTQTRSGLALVVGGMEVTLLDLANAYATLGRRGYRERPHLYVIGRTAWNNCNRRTYRGLYGRPVPAPAGGMRGLLATMVDMQSVYGWADSAVPDMWLMLVQKQPNHCYLNFLPCRGCEPMTSRNHLNRSVSTMSFLFQLI